MISHYKQKDILGTICKNVNMNYVSQDIAENIPLLLNADCGYHGCI